MSNNDEYQTRGNSAQPDQRREQEQTSRQSAPREERTASQNTQAPSWTLADLARAQGRPTTGGISDAALKSMLDAFEGAKGFDKAGVPEEIKRSRFRAIPLDSTTGRTPSTSLLIALPTRVNDQSFILVYVLLIQQPGGVQFRTMNERNESYDALIVPRDVMTERYIGVIKDQVSSLQAGSNILIVGSQVITSAVVSRLNDKDAEAIMTPVYDNALDAICGYRENIVDHITGNRADGARINPDMVARTDRLEVSFDYNAAPGLDTSGLPIRTDVLTALYYSQLSPDEDNMYSRVLLGTVRAGLDMYAVDDGIDRSRKSFGQGRRRRGSREDEPEAFYAPIFNITGIQAAPGLPFTLEMAQFLIAQTALQSNEYRWANVLRPRNVIGGGLKAISQLSHLHLLNPDAEKQGIIEDISQNMSDDDLFDFLDVTVKPDIIYGLIVPSSGEKAWALSIYEGIALSDPRRAAEMAKQLFASADVLTGNRFTRIYRELNGGDTPLPVSSAGTKALIGTWTDEDGNVRDVREWNVPAFLTKVGAKNVELARDYQWTFEDTRYSVDHNLAARYSILNRIVPGLNIVDTCEQLVLLPTYIQALSEALAEAGMASLPTTGDGLNSNRRVSGVGLGNFAASDLGVQRRRPNDTVDRSRGRSRDDGPRYF